MRPYYQDDLVTLYNADCIEVLPEVHDVELVVTSPPYNLGGEPWPHLGNWKPGDSIDGKSKWRNGSDGSAGMSYDAHSDSMPWPDYVSWQHALLTACWATLSDTGAIFYNHKPRVIGAKLWNPTELNPGLPHRQTVIWARSGGMNYNATAYVSTHEWLMIFAKEAWRLRDQGASGLGDVWTVPQERSDHPAPFPISIPARAIETTKPGLVLDPMSGSGTTLRAAKDAGRRAVGIEISEAYCEMSALRLGQEAFDLEGIA